MNDRQIPHSWIGSKVMLVRNTATQAELVNLESVGKQGMVCSYLRAEVTEPVLIPWTSISWIRPAVAEELDA